MNTGVYKLYWPKQGNYYIGQSCNLRARKSQHLTELKRGDHRHKKIQACYKKHGLPIFEVVKLCSVDELDHYEQFYIGEKHNAQLCFNKVRTLPIMRATIALSREQYKQISNMANSDTCHKCVRKYIENLVATHLATHQ